MSEDLFKEFYNKSLEERLAIVKKFANLTEQEMDTLKSNPLPLQTANRMIENVIGIHPLPLGLATNFIINGKETIIPMAVEEPSVVAAASFAAKLCQSTGGFTAWADEPIMIGQIQLIGVKDFETAKRNILEKKEKLIEKIVKEDPSGIESFGGGVKDIQVREINSLRGKMLIVHVLINLKDAMGGNIIDTITEELAQDLEQLTGGQSRIRVISNLGIYKKGYAKAVWPKKALENSVKGKFTGEEVVERILDGYAFAEADPYRCATNNKGIMNGIDAAAIATGNDWRAVEAGAHAYAATKQNGYKPLAKYYKNENGDLVGEVELPIVVATFGSVTSIHPLAPIARKILGVTKATELTSILAALGLAQNFAAIRALATEGIQKGHMKLHTRSYAIMAGAKEEEILQISQRMIQENKIKLEYAQQFLKELRENHK